MKSLIEGNLLLTDSEKTKLSKRTYNAICVIAIIFCVFTTIGYLFILDKNEWIGLAVTFGLGIIFVIIYTLVMKIPELYNKHELLFKRLVIVLLTLWLFYESNIVGGFYYKSLETSFMMYLIIVPALLDVMFVSVGLVAGMAIIVYHALMYMFDTKVPIMAMQFLGIAPLSTQDEIWLFLLLYLSIWYAIRSFIRTNKKYQKTIEKQNNKNKHELNVAKEILRYSDIETPKEFYAKYKLGASQVPYYEISGDFYFITKMLRKYYVFLVDICGHGLEAAMFVWLLKKELYKLKLIDIKSTAVSFTNEINGFLESVDKSATITIVQIDPDNGDIEYINCGNYVFIYDGERCRELVDSGFGLMEDYKTMKDNIKNKALILMSDGIIESTNNYSVPFGVERVKNIIAKGGDIKNNIVAEYEKYKIRVHDDVTILTIEDKT